jgi:hypothetical protein
MALGWCTPALAQSVSPDGSAKNGGVSANLEVANEGQMYVLTASGSWWIWQNGSWTQTSAPSASSPSLPDAPPPTLTLTVAPYDPSVPSTGPLGAVVATVPAAWSNGSRFTGTINFVAPYNDDGGTFALSCTQCATANLVISPLGMGVSGDGGTVQKVTLQASQ